MPPHIPPWAGFITHVGYKVNPVDLRLYNATESGVQLPMPGIADLRSFLDYEDLLAKAELERGTV